MRGLPIIHQLSDMPFRIKRKEMFRNALKIAGRFIEATNKQIGFWFGWIFLIITIVIVYDVFMRYFLGSPTEWATYFSTYSFGIISVLGGGYVLLRKAHVRTDVFSVYLSPRSSAIVDVVLFLFFAIFVLSLLFTGWDLLWTAIKKGRKLAGTAPWPLWPYLLAIPVGALLIFMQGIVDFVKNVRIAVHGMQPEIDE
jgi:TRAP-type mannitol/chloroaromatic compound transport system permease small subunit